MASMVVIQMSLTAFRYHGNGFTDLSSKGECVVFKREMVLNSYFIMIVMKIIL